MNINFPKLMTSTSHRFKKYISASVSFELLQGKVNIITLKYPVCSILSKIYTRKTKQLFQHKTNENQRQKKNLIINHTKADILFKGAILKLTSLLWTERIENVENAITTLKC